MSNFLSPAEPQRLRTVRESLGILRAQAHSIHRTHTQKEIWRSRHKRCQRHVWECLLSLMRNMSRIWGRYRRGLLTKQNGGACDRWSTELPKDCNWQMKTVKERIFCSVRLFWITILKKKKKFLSGDFWHTMSFLWNQLCAEIFNVVSVKWT